MVANLVVGSSLRGSRIQLPQLVLESHTQRQNQLEQGLCPVKDSRLSVYSIYSDFLRIHSVYLSFGSDGCFLSLIFSFVKQLSM